VNGYFFPSDRKSPVVTSLDVTVGAEKTAEFSGRTFLENNLRFLRFAAHGAARVL
jgi:hypothetical protein